MALLKDATRSAVREAPKHRQANGHSFVDLFLENASDVGQALLIDPTLRKEDLAGLSWPSPTRSESLHSNWDSGRS